MTLSNIQLRKINTFLEIKGVSFIDIKAELKDHLANQVQDKMINDNLSFESAFNNIRNEWEKELALTTSLWIGLSMHLPKIILSKLIITLKQILIKHLVLGVLFSLFLLHFTSDDILGVRESVLGLLAGVSFGLYFLNAIYYYRIRRSNLRTTYGKLSETNSIPFLIIGLNLLGTYPASLASGDLFFKILLFFNLLILSLCTLMNIWLYKNHMLILKKLKYVTY
jgi:hypothetical protein